jgi:hypothetical protein
MLQSEITPSDATAQRHPALNDAGEIRDDSPCVSCQYNLRALRMEGLCPECGTPIKKSLPPDMLRYAPEKWLEFVFLGASLLWTVQLWTLNDYMMGTLYSIRGFEYPPRSTWEVVGMLGLGLMGCCLLTVRDKHSFETTRIKRYRWIARVGVTAYAINAICVRLTGWWMDITATLTITYLVETFVLIAVAAEFLYLRCLLNRIPRPRWARSIMFVIVAHCIVRLVGLSRIGPFLALELGGDSEQNLMNVVGPLLRAYQIADFLAGLAWIPFALVYLWMLIRLMFHIWWILKARKKEKARAALPQS